MCTPDAPSGDFGEEGRGDTKVAVAEEEDRRTAYRSLAVDAVIQVVSARLEWDAVRLRCVPRVHCVFTFLFFCRAQPCVLKAVCSLHPESGQGEGAVGRNS